MFSGKCEDPHIVYSKEIDDVTMPCENVVAEDCSSTTWLYSSPGSQDAIEEVTHGSIRSENTNRADRLKLEPDCSLKIINVTSQDAGEYTCRQFLTTHGQQDGEDTVFYLSILTVSSSIASEMKANTTVTFYCHLTIHDHRQNGQDGTKIVWTGFNQRRVKDVYPYIISFTRTLTKEDKNRKLQCKVESKGELKATLDYIINLQGQDGSHPVGLIGAVVGAVAVALCAFLVFLWRRKKATAMAPSSLAAPLKSTQWRATHRPRPGRGVAVLVRGGQEYVGWPWDKRPEILKALQKADREKC
ncbi:uncharacterized protein LOC125299347 [Alosa alosa]|uniref:uncharacterized protein LOC125299347 n=1 Tax=Alosa alosa TaxID=278164 RepID=UPI0020151CEC|nr:uncharacterized protein LOC125299347 [Alosa alosa]